MTTIPSPEQLPKQKDVPSHPTSVLSHATNAWVLLWACGAAVFCWHLWLPTLQTTLLASHLGYTPNSSVPCRARCHRVSWPATKIRAAIVAYALSTRRGPQNGNQSCSAANLSKAQSKVGEVNIEGLPVWTTSTTRCTMSFIHLLVNRTGFSGLFARDHQADVSWTGGPVTNKSL
eukprot:4369174-Amphidinium_carterae.1